MKVLFVSPFAPHARHNHAAADTVSKLIPRLAEEVEMVVFCPAGQDEVPQQSAPAYASRYFARSSPTLASRFGVAPAWMRTEWPRSANYELEKLVANFRPDVIHAEYLHSGEVALEHSHVLLGLHDNATSVLRKSADEARGVERVYRFSEYYRTRRFERNAAAAADTLVVLSEPDANYFKNFNSRVRVVRPGVTVPERSWSPTGRSSPSVVFTGAMWRRANQLVAEMLVKDVMPLVWAEDSDVSLRIVGSQPPAGTTALGDDDPRVIVTGHVSDLDAELMGADAVLAPSLLGGGVMMKVIRAMALGCPTITTTEVAASVGAGPGELLLADRSDVMASMVLAVVKSCDSGAAVGQRARGHVARSFSWDVSVKSYLDLYQGVSER